MIRWIDTYDLYIYDNDKDIQNKNICINIPYEPLNEDAIVDKYLIGRVEKRQRYFNKKIAKHEARNLKRKQQMKNKSCERLMQLVPITLFWRFRVIVQNSSCGKSANMG